MNNRLKPFLPLLLCGVLATSCDKNELDEAVTEKTSASSDATAYGSILFEETNESSLLFSGTTMRIVKDVYHSYGLTTSGDVAFGGTKSARFELRDTDSEPRSEVAFPVASGKDRWYSYSVYFPADGYAYDNNEEIITQWHSIPDSGESWGSPATYFMTNDDKFQLNIGYNTNAISSGAQAQQTYWLGGVTKNKWHQFVFHIVHSYGSDGLVEVWHDGQKVVEHRGGNRYNDAQLPYMKLGVYKWTWQNQSTDTNKRVLYFDNVRVGNESATLAAMTAGSPTTAPAPIAPTDPTTGGLSYTLVNADTERDIMPLTNGAVLTLANLATRNLNVRVNKGSVSFASAKFELTGAQYRTKLENTAPYALASDNGVTSSGLPNYSAWTPRAGNYTLKVTPYSGTNATGTAGTPYTISFTVR